MYCKKCGSTKYVKAGFVKGEQRYKCNDCGCKFVPTRNHGKFEKDKLLAVWLYSRGLSLRTIAKLFNVTVKAVFNWVNTYAKTSYIKPASDDDTVIVDLDAMWKSLNTKKTKQGYGKLVAVIPINLSTGSVEGETMLHFQNLAYDQDA